MKNLLTIIFLLVIITWLTTLMSCSKDDGISNGAPIVSNQSFTIAENSRTGIVVGTVMASDPEMDTLTFNIGSSELNALIIDKTSGVLSVLDRNALDYETIPVFIIDVEVSDGNKTTTSIVTINLTDVPEYALQFDGNVGYVSIADAPELNSGNAITIALWVRLEEDNICDVVDSERALISKGFYNQQSGYSCRVNCDGALAWWLGTENGLSLYGTGEALVVNKWTFVTFTYEGSSGDILIYMDGIQDQSGEYDPDSNGSGSINSNDDPLYFSIPAGFHPEIVSFPGSIDDVSVWYVALNSDQIVNIMENGIDGTEQGLVSYWSCNANSGTTVADQVSDNDGIMNEGVDWIGNP